jgi:Chloramphenicol phosphotransferase-like protein
MNPILFLNGTSSSGKTTIARQFQKIDYVMRDAIEKFAALREGAGSVSGGWLEISIETGDQCVVLSVPYSVFRIPCSVFCIPYSVFFLASWRLGVRSFASSIYVHIVFLS